MGGARKTIWFVPEIGRWVVRESSGSLFTRTSRRGDHGAQPAQADVEGSWSDEGCRLLGDRKGVHINARKRRERDAGVW
jgi:hypothetical protein